MIPKYSNLKCTNNSPVSQVTTKKAQVIRTKDEIKFLFKKKQRLDHDLYMSHTKVAQEWGGISYNIHKSICENLNFEMEKVKIYVLEVPEDDSIIIETCPK